MVLAAILAGALVVRLVRIGAIPGNVMLDEADNALNAYFILAGRGGDFFGVDWSQAPLLSMHVLAGCIRVFGDSVAGIRSMPVLLSTASLVPFFLLARRQVSLFAAACAAALLATSLWYLHFSRTAWINMTAPLFALCAVYFLTRALEHGRLRDYLCCGGFIALGAYGYPAGQSIPVAVLAALPFALLLHPEHRKRTLAGFILALSVAAALLLPHLLFVAQDEAFSQGRMSQVSIFARAEYLGDTGLATILLHQIGRNLAGFVLLDRGQMGRGLWAHYLPPARAVLDHGTGLLFWIGLVAGAFRWRGTFLWWLLLLVPVLTVQVFSVQTPDAGRGLIVAPFMYLFVALGVESILTLRRRWSPRIVAGLLLGAVVLLGARNVWEYFVWIQSRQALDEREPAVELAEFRPWSRLQREDIASGGPGFGVSEWRERIDSDGCKNGTLHGSVCGQTDLLSESSTGVLKRSLGSPTDRAQPMAGNAAVPAEELDEHARHAPPDGGSAGASLEARDLARRGDLANLARALERFRADGHPYPTTQDRVQSACYYPSDAGCALRAVLDPLPADPRSGAVPRGYWYRSDGTTYTLYAVLEGAASAGEGCPERPTHIETEGELICLRGP